MNPAALAEAQYENKLKCLEQECEKLRERVRILEAGQTHDVTQAVNLHLAASSAQEVQGTGHIGLFDPCWCWNEEASWEDWKHSRGITEHFLSLSKTLLYNSRDFSVSFKPWSKVNCQKI
jgi:hypothetical protein